MGVWGWGCSCGRRGQSPREGSLSLSLLRMGANHSKERAQEGVLSQMKTLLKSPNNNRPVVAPVAVPQRSTSRSSSVGSPPPSPRSLSDTLASPQLQASFLQFLQDLDHNAGIPPDHCGRAGSLEFVLAVKQLQIEAERNRPEDWVRFFPPENKATGLVLNNDPQLWLRCAEATRKEELTEDDLQALLLARDHCLRKLSREHQEFLRQRASEKATAMSKLASCCVLL